jgi:hypothetical protein
MKPVTFPEANTTYGANQPEYLPLPCYRNRQGDATSCWQLSWLERITAFCTGRVFVRQLTGNQPLQPICASVGPASEICEDALPIFDTTLRDATGEFANKLEVLFSELGDLAKRGIWVERIDSTEENRRAYVFQGPIPAIKALREFLSSGEQAWNKDDLAKLLVGDMPSIWD